MQGDYRSVSIGRGRVFPQNYSLWARSSAGRSWSSSTDFSGATWIYTNRSSGLLITNLGNIVILAMRRWRGWDLSVGKMLICTSDLHMNA